MTSKDLYSAQVRSTIEIHAIKCFVLAFKGIRED